MTRVLTAHRPPVHPAPTAPAPRLSAREDLLTVAFAGWLVLGLFVDGWAHNTDKPETFFTPWHGLFYSGFVATALWMGSRYLRYAAWSDPSSREPSLRGFLPPLLSITLVTATVSFFLMVFSPFLSNVATKEPYRFIEMADPILGEWLAEELQITCMASLGGFGLALLMGPPAQPGTVETT